MAVHYEEPTRLFTLETRGSVYQMKVDAFGFLLHLYYGKRTGENMEYLLTYYDRGFSGNPYDVDRDRTYSMDALPQEYPVWGNGDFRSPCLETQMKDGSFGSDLRYQGYEIEEGKYKLPGLPAVYGEKDEAQTLKIYMTDDKSGLKVTLYYGVMPEYDVITRAVELKNQGQEAIWLGKVQSACLDFLQGDYEWISFYGRHAMERTMQRVPVVHGSQVIGSRRGASSHQYNPFMILTAPDTTETNGECYGLSFVYSGSFKAEVAKDQYNQVRVSMGLQEERFCFELKPGQTFFAPEVVLAYSAEGLGALSRQYHKLYRYHLCRGKYKTIPRPVLVNNWEATYFDFTGDKIYEIGKHARELGIEMLVLDDGWFGKRDTDYSGLGDWEVNEKKVGGPLKSLVDRINGLGLKFGLWVEPEMVSEDSDLYRTHPDWAFAIPGRKPIRSRSQLVLDFSRPEVVDHIYRQISLILDNANIEYMKWDMNRSIADVYSATTAAKNQGEVLYRYMLGLYDFLERLHVNYPDLLLEGCCGGGGRFDAGMLYYSPQIWGSDNTDAIDRISIQYGTSFGYPVSSVGSHVSATPNHQNGRITSLQTRGVVAMAGSFGDELDLCKLTEEEKEVIKLQIKDYHKYWDLIHNGDYYRLTDVTKRRDLAAWQFVSEDKKKTLINLVMLETHGNPVTSYIKAAGLAPEKKYREEKSGRTYTGAALMYGGLPVPQAQGEYLSYQFYLVEV